MTPNVYVKPQASTGPANHHAVSTCCMAFAFPSRWPAALRDSTESKNRLSSICQHFQPFVVDIRYMSLTNTSPRKQVDRIIWFRSFLHIKPAGRALNTHL